MRIVASALLAFVLGSTALADIAPRPMGAKRPQPPSPPPIQGEGPGGGEHASRIHDGPTMGPAAKAETGPASASPEAATPASDPSLASLDVAPPTDSDDESDRNVKMVGAIVLVIGVYIASRLVRRGAKSE